MHIDAKQKGTGAIQEHQHNNNSWQHLWMKHTQHTESTGKQTVRTHPEIPRQALLHQVYNWNYQFTTMVCRPSQVTRRRRILDTRRRKIESLVLHSGAYQQQRTTTAQLPVFPRNSPCARKQNARREDTDTHRTSGQPIAQTSDGCKYFMELIFCWRYRDQF